MVDNSVVKVDLLLIWLILERNAWEVLLSFNVNSIIIAVLKIWTVGKSLYVGQKLKFYRVKEGLSKGFFAMKKISFSSYYTVTHQDQRTAYEWRVWLCVTTKNTARTS